MSNLAQKRVKTTLIKNPNTTLLKYSCQMYIYAYEMSKISSLSSRVPIFYRKYASMEKLVEHDIFKVRQLKRWSEENTILATRAWPNGNYAV